MQLHSQCPIAEAAAAEPAASLGGPTSSHATLSPAPSHNQCLAGAAGCSCTARLTAACRWAATALTVPCAKLQAQAQTPAPARPLDVPHKATA